jgi:hypothetical protein
MSNSDSLVVLNLKVSGIGSSTLHALTPKDLDVFLAKTASHQPLLKTR